MVMTHSSPNSFKIAKRFLKILLDNNTRSLSTPVKPGIPLGCNADLNGLRAGTPRLFNIDGALRSRAREQVPCGGAACM